MKKNRSFKDMDNRKFWASIGLLIAGVVIIFIGVFSPPLAVVDNSLIAIFGEIIAFAAGVFGIDSKYNSKMREIEAKYRYLDRRNNTTDEETIEDEPQEG